MQSLEGQKLIYKLQNELQDKGLVVESTIADLKVMRALMIEEKDPFLTKILRLMYQHLEAHNGFFVAIPSDEADEDEEGAESKEEPVVGVESFLYLLELIADSKNRHNRSDLQAYMDSLGSYNG